ncbi:MAG: hypothetical protein ACI906_001977 [Candidatus Latescibacterota bacterium]|jgi:hypothetical protein
MRPHILITEREIVGLRSLEQVRSALETGHTQVLWQRLCARVEAHLVTEPLRPTTALAGRDVDSTRHANPDYVIVQAVCERVTELGLFALLREDKRCAEAALAQMRTLFDTAVWPDWRDQAHYSVSADLRTGQLSQALALAYDWLYPLLSGGERAEIIAGIDRCGIQPYLKAVSEDAWWLHKKNNWQACVVGGLGIAGMALGEDHAQSQELVDLSIERLRDYRSIYGPLGEFNENVAYAGATRLPITFFAVHRYWAQGGENVLAATPFPATGRWYMHFTAPPGRMAEFGDSPIEAGPMTSHYAALAAATGDGLFQWFYQTYPGRDDAVSLPLELLWYDERIEPVGPVGQLPKGAAFPAHSGCISSRADWGVEDTPSLVFSKAGHGAEGHGNHDAGQVCIDGYGQRLIVDLGTPPMYPADFFGEQRYEYYNASVLGHNVLSFDGEEMKSSAEDRAEIVDARFDPLRGGCWELDLTGCYAGVEKVTRRVIHLLPNVVAVLDEAHCAQEREIALRWHTADKANPDADGAFVVENNGVYLVAKVVSLEGGDMVCRRGEHAYEAPYNTGRLGDEFAQRRESYVEAVVRTDHCRLLTLFAVYEPGEGMETWREGDGGWTIEVGEQRPRVGVFDGRFAAIAALAHGWVMDLAE